METVLFFLVCSGGRGSQGYGLFLNFSRDLLYEESRTEWKYESDEGPG